MLTITINNRPLALNREFSLILSWVNPTCFFDKIPGDAGLGIDIPVNKTNRAILGNPERFEKFSTSGSVNKFPGTSIAYQGALLISGTLVITGANSETYSGWLQSDLGVMGEEQQKKVITDMEWPADVDFVNKATYDEATDHYCTAQILNRYFWEGRGREIQDNKTYENEEGEEETADNTISWLSSEFRRLFEFIVNQKGEDGKTKATGNACVVSPYLFLKYVLKEMLKMNRWFIDENCLAQTMFENLMLYNNFNIMKQEFTTQGGIVPWYNQDTEQWEQRYIEEIVDAGWVAQDFNYANLLPKYSMKDFILGLQNFLNIVFYFKKHNRVDILDRENIILGRIWNESTSSWDDVEPVDLDSYFIDQWQLSDPKSSRLKFMSEYDKNDSFFGDEWHDLSDRWQDLRDDVQTKEQLEDITTDPIGSIRRVKMEEKYYEYKWTTHITYDPVTLWEKHTDILAWEFISVGPQYYMCGYGAEVEEIKSCFSTLHRKFFLDDWWFPVTLQRGNMEYMKALWNDFSPRLLFYRGNVKATAGNAAFNDNFMTDDDNALVLEWDQNYGVVNWDQDHGLFNRRWKHWSNFWITRQQVAGSFDLPLNVLIFLVNNITRILRTRHGKFIIEEMEVEIGLDQIGRTRIKGYKL